ncbi:MAG: ferrous iron transport protein B [Spirochaetia bacterium]|nr:ferrous iron transport protein B [Spirochaetia bacterium]
MTPDTNGNFTPKERHIISAAIDKLLTGPATGLPIFLFVVFLVFKATFSLGQPLSAFIEWCFNTLADVLLNFAHTHNAPVILESLIHDGLVGGVGSVAMFVPNIAIMFFIIAGLEDSGYMARAALIMDKYMHKVGLHGSSFMPLMLGFGCSVPAIMAASKLKEKKDRFITMLVIPFMSCSAKLPVYMLFASVFFEQRYRAIVVWLMYVLGALMGGLTARVFSKVVFKEDRELLKRAIPRYRWPRLSRMFGNMWFGAKTYLMKVITVIVTGSIIIWLLGNLPLGVQYASENSLIGYIGKAVAPILKPAGFGFWQAGVSLITGVMAKEITVSTFGTIVGAQGITVADGLKGLFTPISAFSFMIFTLLYTPCLGSLALLKKEGGTKWMALVTLYTFTVAWLAAVAVYQVGTLLFFR